MAGIRAHVGHVDPVSFVMIPVLLLTVTALASWLPSRRGARSDPMTVLREE